MPSIQQLIQICSEMNNINDLVPMADVELNRPFEPTGSVSNHAILQGKIRDKSKQRKAAKPLKSKSLAEYKSFEELFGEESMKYPYPDDDLIKEQNLLRDNGWTKVQGHKHHPGLFEEVYEHPNYPRIRIQLMDLRDWHIERDDEILKHGNGFEELEAFLKKAFK